MLFGVMLLVASACARRDPGDPIGVNPGPVESFALRFNAPLGVLGERVEDLADANLSFVPVAPAIAADLATYVAPAPGAPEAVMLALVYEDPAWDRIIVLEYVSHMSQAEMLADEEQLVDQGCVAVPEHGPDAISCQWDPFTQVDIGGGFVALLGISPKEQHPALTTMEWIQPLVRTKSGQAIGPGRYLDIAIQGYETTFSPEEAVAFAKEMVASQG
jgi:hypothetical protein